MVSFNVGTCSLMDCEPIDCSVGEAKLNDGNVDDDEASMGRIGHTRYTSKYPGCIDVADCGDDMVGILGVGE